MTKLFFNFLMLGSSLLCAQHNPLRHVNADDQRLSVVEVQKQEAPKIDPILHVNPFIGTGGHGHTYPGASAPFGMMQLSPDTRHDGWDGCSGYHYSDSIIYGFSHTHLSGTGVSDYGDLLVVPQSTNAKPKTNPLFEDKTNGYGSKFSHKEEKASPGYYAVRLLDQDIDVQLTTTQRAGIHRYKFNQPNEKKYILLDLDYRDEVLNAHFSVLDSSSIQGYRISKAWAEEQHFYFHLETSIPFLNAKKIKTKGKNKLLLTFPKDSQEILLRVGMSAVDCGGAKRNLRQEIPTFDFETIKKRTENSWRNELKKIEFDSFDPEANTIFYTALYHSFLSPDVFSDVDGQYRGLDKQIHQLPENQREQYTVFSLWDTFRATHPLFTLTQTDKVEDFIRTFLNQYQQGGDLPVWELAGSETECMIGYHSVSVIADAYLKGIRNFDAKTALNAMIKTANDSAFGKSFYAENGYLSLADEPESVSKVLEYAYNDFCIYKMALAMGETEIAYEFYTRSFNFINHFDPETHFFRARRGGQWMSPFYPDEVNFNYTEANAWQYSLFAPHAISVLQQIHGNDRKLVQHLDEMFVADTKTSGREQADITGLIGQYAHGNEPSHHMAYLYNYVGRPDKTQLFVDSILKSLYSNAPDGLSGNEDCGQMSSWYVLSALGFYPIAPGSPYYDIGRPFCTSAKIHLPNQREFKIEVIDNSIENKFIAHIFLNGRPLERSYLSHQEILEGGHLTIYMSDEPGQMNFYQHAPTLHEIPKDFCPVPYFKTTHRVFEGRVAVEISVPNLNDSQSYTIEYQTENQNWEQYLAPIVLTQNTKISARTVRDETLKSAAVSAEFVRQNTDLSMTLLTPFVHPYSAGGDNALIDGIKGNNEFRTGDWQGFYGEDVRAEIQFAQSKQSFSIEIGILEDLKSWIFYPELISIEVSYDGKKYELYEKKIVENRTNNYRPSQTKRISFEVKTKKPVRSIRVTAKNPGDCPAWHLGAGFESWLFLDEISIH